MKLTFSECKVYATSIGHRSNHLETDGLYLQTVFTGTRAQCHAYVRRLAKHGRPTHFLTVSALDLYSASKKFL